MQILWGGAIKGQSAVIVVVLCAVGYNIAADNDVQHHRVEELRIIYKACNSKKPVEPIPISNSDRARVLDEVQDKTDSIVERLSAD